jgi:hypothetical protein
MKNDSELLRQLHKVQISIPDKDFFAHHQGEIKSENKKRKKVRTGILSGASFLGPKKATRLEIEIAREKIKSFNNSFKVRRPRKSPDEDTEPGIMSIQEMNEFRNSIKESSDSEEVGYSFRALEAIVKFIDLKNSGIITNKQDILLDCLKKLGLVLSENGGLSMFHATWFYSIYKEYLGHFRMFRQGEFEKTASTGSKETKEIAKKLLQKQYELPQYLQLIDNAKRDIKQLLRYSKDPYVKRSIHGQRGCSIEHIKKTFHEKIKADQGKSSDQTYLNEVNIFMSYALFFTRFPMMHHLVETLARSIPNLNTETTLYKEKIMISLNLIQLDLMRGIARNDGSDQYGKRLFEMAYSIYKRCTNLITDNRLTKDNLFTEIHAFPFLKQAIILITYKQLFGQNRGTFLKMIENSREILEKLKEAASGPYKHLGKAREFVAIYERNLDSIVEQIKIDTPKEKQSASPKKQQPSED